VEIEPFETVLQARRTDDRHLHFRITAFYYIVAARLILWLQSVLADAVVYSRPYQSGQSLVPNLVRAVERNYTNGGLDRTLGREALRQKQVTDACRSASSSLSQSSSRILGWIRHVGVVNVVLSSFSHIGMSPVPHGSRRQ
jgi:hypothetical protein